MLTSTQRTTLSSLRMFKSTPLHLAVANQHIDIVSYFLSLKGLIDVRNNEKSVYIYFKLLLILPSLTKILILSKSLMIT